jgi:hypothetical protein
MRTTEIYSDTRKPGTCRGRSCGAAIVFATIVKSGKTMPFSGDPVALKTRHEDATHRLIETVDLGASHFADCPDAKKF